MNDLAAH